MFQTLFRNQFINRWSFLAAGVALVLLAGLAVFISALQPVDRKAQMSEVELIIERGAGIKDIALILLANKLIKSADAFHIYSFISGSAHLFKPGFYRLSPSWNIPQLTRIIVAGPADTLVAISEGETLKDIDFKLSQLGIIKKGELENFQWDGFKDVYPFLAQAKSLEGFLFPDTYHFSSFSPIEIVVNEMLKNFYKKAWPLLLKSSKNYYSSLITASLIEKETPFSNDRLLVSGVIKNRLSLGMPLQIDASIAYGKCGGRFLTCDSQTRQLFKSDLAIDNQFNTYLNKGLPPAPIANPGTDAIMAALNPKSTSYLYYLSNPQNRKAIFATTLDEHNDNRVKYLRQK